ncbi:hypothetical protein [Longimicrobium sp.]|jgi:hypothetical protein|uniref:hypothetical protein n=1 Tax=Longimicrobium sp. TaxID=2029185 RepID=UPI002F959380
MSSTRPVLRAFVCALAIVTIAANLLPLVEFAMAVRAGEALLTPGVIGVVLLLVLAPLSAAGLALVLAWRSWMRDDARVLALFLGLLSYALGAEGTWSVLRKSGLPDWAVSVLDTGMPLAAVAGMAVMIRFSGIFPRPLSPRDIRPGVSRAGRIAAYAQLWAMDPARLRSTAAWFCGLVVVVPQALSISTDLRGDEIDLVVYAKYLVLAALLATVTLSAANLRTNYRLADAAGRRQVFWVLEGFLFATAVAVLASALKLLQNATGYQAPLPHWYALALVGAFLGLLACLAIALFGSGALDPSLALRRTAVSGMLGLLAVVLFAVSEQVMQEWLGARLGLSPRTGGIVTGVALGLAFEPLRTRTSAFVERQLARFGAEAPAPATPLPVGTVLA